MLKNILKLDGVQVLGKTEQTFIKGGDLINCFRNIEHVNGSYQYIIECWDTDQDRYRRFNILGREVGCDE